MEKREIKIKEDNKVEEKMSSDFARNLTLLRKERKLSQKQVAADLGISQALLSHYEKGVRECGLKFLVKAADYYNVSCDSLLGRGLVGEDEAAEALQGAEFRRRALGASVNVLMNTSRSCGDQVEEKVSSCMMLTVYKLMQIIKAGNIQSRENILKKSLADGALSLKEAEIMALVAGNGLCRDRNSLPENFEKQCEKIISDITNIKGK